jgi:excisionase family DNA binding protein
MDMGEPTKGSPAREYYSADEVAEKLNLHPRTVRRMLNNGQLPGVRFGSRQWRIPHALFEEYVRNEVRGRKPPVAESKSTDSDSGVKFGD